MIGSLKDPEHHAETLPEQIPESRQTPPNVEEYRPPVIGLALAFILLFWGSIFLGWVFWPR
jgi:hypothetical protein